MLDWAMVIAVERKGPHQSTGLCARPSLTSRVKVRSTFRLQGNVLQGGIVSRTRASRGAASGLACGNIMCGMAATAATSTYRQSDATKQGSPCDEVEDCFHNQRVRSSTFHFMYHCFHDQRVTTKHNMTIQGYTTGAWAHNQALQWMVGMPCTSPRGRHIFHFFCRSRRMR